MSDNTLVTFVLDRSGSMGSIIEGTLESYNAYVDGMRSTDGIFFTLVQFDSGGIDRVHFETPIAQVPALTRETYVPRGGTPLIDAAFNTIEALEKAVNAKAVKPKVVVCIQTDGEENSSREHTWSELKELIGKKTAEGWQFTFMGAGIDAYDQAGKMGIGIDNAVSYKNDRAATRAAFSATALNTVAYASGASMGVSYSASQKLAAGDEIGFSPSVGSTVSIDLTSGPKKERKLGVTL